MLDRKAVAAEVNLAMAILHSNLIPYKIGGTTTSALLW